MEERESSLVDWLRWRPDDLETRAALEDHLRERDHPGADFIRIDRELSTVARNDARYDQLRGRLVEISASLTRAWMCAIGSLDATRFDVYATSPDSFSAIMYRHGEAVFGGRPSISNRAGLDFERGLRRVEAEALAARLGPDAEVGANRGASSLAAFRWALPWPQRWSIRQPPFNRYWTLRDPELGRRYYPRNHLELVAAPGRRLEVMRLIHEHLPLSTHERRELVECGGVVAANLADHRADEVAGRFAELGAVVRKVGAPFAPDNTSHLDHLTSGYPIQVAAEATPTQLRVHHTAIVWDLHTPNLDLTPAVALDFDELSGARAEELVLAVDQVIERRQATFRTCRECGEIKPPEWMGHIICQSCAERRGVVH